jgi:DNA replication protein DnaC
MKEKEDLVVPARGPGNRNRKEKTLNRPFKEWNQIFPNATCIVTMLDRLLHNAEVTVIEGESYRVRESELEAAVRRRKK